MRLLEREPELTAADVALRAAATGRGGVVVASGPPGIGRSALLDAIAGSPAAEQFRLLRANGTVAEQDFGFGAVQQLFQPLITGSPEREAAYWLRGAAGLARQLLVDEPWSVAHVARETVLHALHSLVVNVSEDRPLLVVVDDLQWVDSPTLRLLGYLAKRVSRVRILVVAAISEHCETTDSLLLGDIAASASHFLQPVPLSAHAVRTLLAEQRGSDDGELAQACHEVTGGNPAAVAEILRGLPVDGLSPAGDIGATIQSLLRERRMSCLATAPGIVRDLAEALVVLGDLAVPELLKDLAGLDRVAYRSALQILDRLGLLVDTEPPRFVHPTVYAGVAAAMTAEVHKRLHREAARLLRIAGYPAEQVADHLLMVGSGFERWEIDVLRNAAGTVLERGAAGVAARYLRAALLDNPVDGVERARLLVDLAAAERGVDPLSSAEHIARALPFLEPGVERATAVLWVHPALAAADPSLAELVRQAADELADQVPARAHEHLVWRLEARVRRLSMQDPVHLARHVDLLRQLEVQQADELVSTGAGRELLAVLGYAAVLTAALPAARVATLVGRILELEPAHPAHAYTAFPALVHTAAAVESIAALEPWLDAAAEEARCQESAGVRRLVAAERALLLAATGRLAQARKTAEAVLQAADPASSEASSMALTALTTVALQSHDVELARQLADATWPTGDVRVTVADGMLRGMVDSVAGDPSAALERFLDCGRQLTRCGWTGPSGVPWRAWAAVLHRRLGDLDSAVDIADEEYRAAQAWGAPGPLGRALRLRGVLTGGDEGLQLLRDSHDVLLGSIDRLELARTAVILGRTLRATGLAGAPQLLTDAERIATECGAVWLQENRAAGHCGGPVLRILRSGRQRLTKTEDSVVALALRGWTNQRIAEAYEVSRRAVEKNLTTAYRKLGVSGRAGLIERFGSLSEID